MTLLCATALILIITCLEHVILDDFTVFICYMNKGSSAHTSLYSGFIMAGLLWVFNRPT